MMLLKLQLLPLFLHVLLILFVGLKLVRARIRSVRNGSAKLDEIAVNASAWPTRVRLLGNNFDSQFDLPLLWYAAVALIIATGQVDVVSVVLAWAFVLLRLLHTLVHTGSNYVPTRMKLYLGGFAVVFAMWAWFALRILVLG